ncbi:MAG: hypothetical protein ABSD88_04670 [Candidatus Korobacteraceae bacterium]|jgi:hypothetical protein
MENKKFYHDADTDTFTLGNSPAGYGTRYTEFWRDDKGVHPYENQFNLPETLKLRATLFGGETLQYHAAGYDLNVSCTDGAKVSIGVGAKQLDSANLRHDAGVVFLEMMKIAKALALRLTDDKVDALAFLLGTGGKGNLWFAL